MEQAHEARGRLEQGRGRELVKTNVARCKKFFFPLTGVRTVGRTVLSSFSCEYIIAFYGRLHVIVRGAESLERKSTGDICH